jgi:hypothetical protein|tara:strand:+ start:57 stop:1514 length:1458 start_codon:yes stop_codon:yes gene_type:complete
MGFRLSPTDAVNFFIKEMKNKNIAAPTKKALTVAFKGVSPSLFFGEDKWSGTTKAQYKIKLSEANFNIIAKNIKIPQSQIKPAAGKKTTTFTVSGYVIGLETSKKTGTASDAESTRKQELASLWMIRSALQPNPKLFKNWDAVTKDKKAFKELTDIYPELITTATEWQAGLCAQQKKINEVLKGAGHYKEFNREGGFMDFISKLVKDEFMIGRKDSWNPADVWVIKTTDGTIEQTLIKAAKGGITRLNETMIQMWEHKKLKGISLKAISGKTAQFEVVNIDEGLFKKMDNSVFELDKIEIPLNLVNGQFGTQDSRIHIKEGETKLIKFQVTQNSKGFNNLKVEGTMVGAGAARAGKVPLDMMKTMMTQDYHNEGINFEIGQFTNKWQDYPKTLAEFNKDSQIYSEMWNTIKDKVISGIKTKQEFDASFQSAWSTQEDIASSKLMQLTFIHAVLKMQEKPQKEFLTNLTFLAQKKGRKFGPFGKLY